MIARFPLAGFAAVHTTRPAVWRRRIVLPASMTLLTR
jgi:hypothetical protein